MRISAFPLREAYPFAHTKGLGSEAEAIRAFKITWARSPHSSVRRGGMIKLFQERGVFEEFIDKSWPDGRTPQGQTKIGWYLRVWDDFQRFLAGGEGPPGDGEDESEEAVEEQAFRYETDLRHFLAHNPSTIEKGMTLYTEHGQTGEEYPVGDRRIDILALDKDRNFVVVELKVSRGHERAIGQLLYYMSWVEDHLAQGRKARGIIIAREITNELKQACKKVADVELYEYELRVTLKKVA